MAPAAVSDTTFARVRDCYGDGGVVELVSAVAEALGMALSDQGKYEAAIAPLETALQQNASAGWETHWALAKARYHTARYEQALEASMLAVEESHGRAPQIALLVAQSLTAVGRYEDAAETLREFLKQHADRVEAATARSWLERLAESGKIQRQRN